MRRSLTLTGAAALSLSCVFDMVCVGGAWVVLGASRVESSSALGQGPRISTSRGGCGYGIRVLLEDASDSEIEMTED